MAHQLDVWQGRFGNDYTDRNLVDWRVRLPAFRQAVQGLPIRHVLEVGCNRGHNLRALSEAIGQGANLSGLEPNRYAAEIARTSTTKTAILQGHLFLLPFKDRVFDLVFTAGVLIHIPLTELPRGLAEIYRVSQRYILAIEYFAEEETSVTYRGHDGLLWKRNFLDHYRSQFPDLELLRTGLWNREEGFDRTMWWLLEKGAG